MAITAQARSFCQMAFITFLADLPIFPKLFIPDARKTPIGKVGKMPYRSIYYRRKTMIRDLYRELRVS